MLGLIQVMKNLANIDEVGHGIAVAFVATVYGVASANLLFLPVATKIKARRHAEIAAQGADSGRRVRHRGRAESEADPAEAGARSREQATPKGATGAGESRGE